MRINVLAVFATCLLLACTESDNAEIYNENNTNVVDGIVYDMNERPINGLYKIYYPNGNVKMEVRSKNGRPDGEGKFYDEVGNLLFSGTFKNGVIHGKMYNYYADGTVRNEMNYVNGVQHGTYKTYKENGDLAINVEFEQGKAISGYTMLQEHKVELSAEDLVAISHSQLNNMK